MILRLLASALLLVAATGCGKRAPLDIPPPPADRDAARSA